MNLTTKQRDDVARRHHPIWSLFDNFFDFPLGPANLPETFRRGFAPPVNISEDEKSLSIALEMPGLEEKDIKVEVMGNQLLISAERKFESDKKEKDYHRVEHQYGSFARTIQLPSGLDTEAIEAVYRKGILTLTVPKVEPTPTTRINVKKGE